MAIKAILKNLRELNLLVILIGKSHLLQRRKIATKRGTLNRECTKINWQWNYPIPKLIAREEIDEQSFLDMVQVY